MASGDQAVPVGFPGCRRCALRQLDRPDVCLQCYGRSITGAVAGRSCAVCGQGLPAGGDCANRWCGRADRAFSVVFAVGGYEGALRRAIVDYKYRNGRWWAKVFARLLAGYLDAHAIWFEEFDLVVGMPTYVGPGARRGWDHIALMIEDLAELEAGCWDVAPGALRKVAETKPMSGLSRWARERAAQGPLRRSLRVVDPGAVDGARVLAVDDVLNRGQFPERGIEGVAPGGGGRGGGPGAGSSPVARATGGAAADYRLTVAAGAPPTPPEQRRAGSPPARSRSGSGAELLGQWPRR